MGEVLEAIGRALFQSWFVSALVGAAPRIEAVAADLVRHFEARSAAAEGKAMVVGMSREICARLYNAIVALRPEWHSDDPTKGTIKVVMTGSAADDEHIRRHVQSPAVRRLTERRFKDPADPLRLVIVRDMWLTGFDVPALHTLYVDKPMRGHALMQAIARVNRVFRDKEGGLVVDYIGIAAELRRALQTYPEARGKGRPALRAEEALAKLRELMEVARAMLHGFDYGAYRERAVVLLPQAANHVLGLPDGARRWSDTVLGVSKAFSLCGTLDEAAAMREEVAFFPGRTRGDRESHDARAGARRPTQRRRDPADSGRGGGGRRRRGHLQTRWTGAPRPRRALGGVPGGCASAPATKPGCRAAATPAQR